MCSSCNNGNYDADTEFDEFVEECEECGHPVHGADGCGIERGDRLIGGHNSHGEETDAILMAMGPCPCTYHEDTEGNVELTERRSGTERRTGQPWGDDKHLKRHGGDRRQMAIAEMIDLQHEAGYPFASERQAHLYRLRKIRAQAVQSMLDKGEA